jgi:hypothetical protein
VSDLPFVIIDLDPVRPEDRGTVQADPDYGVCREATEKEKAAALSVLLSSLPGAAYLLRCILAGCTDGYLVEAINERRAAAGLPPYVVEEEPQREPTKIAGRGAYIREIQRQFVAVYNFPELPGKPGLTNPPDGVYPMTINGRVDYVEIKGGFIFCLNFKPPKDKATNAPTPGPVLSGTDGRESFVCLIWSTPAGPREVKVWRLTSEHYAEALDLMEGDPVPDWALTMAGNNNRTEPA